MTGGLGRRGSQTVESTGGRSRKIAEPGGTARWRPDGALIGYIQAGWLYSGYPSKSGHREFWTVKPDGSANELVFVDSTGYLWGSSSGRFDWSPDGKSIVWLRSFTGYGELFIRDLGSGEETELTTFRKEIGDVTWASNGQIFFSSDIGGNTNIWMIAADGGNAVQVTKGGGPDGCARLSADSRRLLFTEARYVSNVWVAQADGRGARQVTYENQGLGSPFLLPDGGRVSYGCSSADAFRPGSHVFVIADDGTNKNQITAGDALYYCPTWSPDGKYLTYGSRRATEPWDSSCIYISEVSHPEKPRLVGSGMHAWWLDSVRFVVVHPGLRVYSTLYSVRSPEPITETEVSVWDFPLPDGRTVLRGDARKAREGWWLHTVGAPDSTADRRILGSEYLYNSWPSISFRYLLYLETNRELWRMSLPDGRRERMPGVFDGCDPWCGFTFSQSYDDRHVVWLKGRLDSRLVLIDNVFE